MKKIDKDTIIEMRPDRDGVFKPVGIEKVINIPSVKRYSYKIRPIRNRKTRIGEFLEGFSIGIELINKFRKGIYR